jgi:uncharacterized membrane protein (DUF485 family)
LSIFLIGFAFQKVLIVVLAFPTEWLTSIWIVGSIVAIPITAIALGKIVILFALRAITLTVNVMLNS